jgi:hypothetical protein
MAFWHRKKRTSHRAEKEYTQHPFDSAEWTMQTVGDRQMKVCNCMSTSQGILTCTSSEKIAETFARLRRDSGEQLRGKVPENAHELTVEHAYEQLAQPPDGPVFKAIQMEDKWDVYFFDRTFQFVRSWTGDLVISADVTMEGDTMHIVKLYSAGTDDAVYALRVVDYLLKSHGLNMVVPHPLPDEVSDVPSDVARHAFAQYGRRGWFATRDDTLGIQSSEKYEFPPYDTAVPRSGSEQESGQ